MTVAVAALTVGLAVPVHADDTVETEATQQDLIEIGTEFDRVALASLSRAEMNDYRALSQVDPTKTETKTTRTFTVNGVAATRVQAQQLENAFGPVSSDLTADAAQVSDSLDSVLIAATVCYYASNKISNINQAGVNLYNHWINIKWCMSGTTVTSTSIIAKGGAATWLGWEYLGSIGSGSGVISNQGRNYAQYKFRLSIFTVGVIQTTYPCMQLHGIKANLVRVGSACGLV